jgi:hypothetical protein
MRLRTVWGLCPAFEFRWDKTTGRARGPLYWVPRDEAADSPLTRHELHHVKQFYFVLWVGIALAALASFYFPLAYASWVPAGVIALYGLWTRTSVGTFMIETAAYGESVRAAVEQGADVEDAVDKYARVFDDMAMYNEAADLAQITSAIQSRYEDRDLF